MSQIMVKDSSIIIQILLKYLYYIVEFLNTLWPTDTMLLNYIRDHIFVPPAAEHLPYFLDKLGKNKDPLGIAAELVNLESKVSASQKSTDVK